MATFGHGSDYAHLLCFGVTMKVWNSSAFPRFPVRKKKLFFAQNGHFQRFLRSDIYTSLRTEIHFIPCNLHTKTHSFYKCCEILWLPFSKKCFFVPKNLTPFFCINKFTYVWLSYDMTSNYNSNTIWSKLEYKKYYFRR